MTRESRHLKVNGFSDNVTEEMLLDHFNFYGRVQKVEFLKEEQNCAVVSFMDLRTAANAINSEHDIRGHKIKATYYEPGGTTSNAVIQIHETTEALHSSAQHRRQAFGQQNYQRSQNRSQNWFNTSSASDQRSVTNRHADEQTFVHSNAAGGSRSNAVGRSGQKRPSSKLSGGRNNRRPSASSNSSGDESCSRSRSRSSQSSRSPSLSASSRGSRTVGGGSSRYSVDSRGRILVDGERRLNSKDGDGGGVSSSGSYKNASILVRNLPLRSTDSSLKDGLFFTYKKHGKVVSVKVVGEGPDRYAVVTFRRSSDTQKAIDATNNVMFFGSKISVEIAPSGLDVDDNERRPLEKDIDQYHPKSSRTLYVGNLENRISPEQLRHFFERFGDVVTQFKDVDIKNRETPAPFAFIQFTDIVSVVKAIHAMEQDGYIGNNKIKVGFGKPLPSPMVWIDELPEHVSSEYLSRKMNFYGSITDILIDKVLHQALITYDCIEAAQCAVQDMKGRTICNRKVQIDFCSRELHDLFVDRMFRTNQLRGREAIYMNESLLPSSASQRLSMSRGNSYEIADFYPVERVENYYEAGSTSSKNYGPNRRSAPDPKHNRAAPPFEERPPYDDGEGEYYEYESSTRDFNRSQEQNQRNAYRTKGRSLTPPQASRHSSNRGHRETEAPAWNGQRSQEDYRANKRPRSPGARPNVDATAATPKKRSSSIDRTDYRVANARHESKETLNDFYSRTESPNFNRERHHIGNSPRDFVQQAVLKKPRTPPTPREKKKKTSSSSSDSSTSVADGSSNGSSSSSSSDDSSSDMDSADAIPKDKVKQEPPDTSSGAPPSSQAHLKVINSASICAASKDPSPDMQKLQRERAQLLQMLETLDGEEKDDNGTNATAMGCTKKAGDKKTTSLSDIFDMSWVKLAAGRKREHTRSVDIQSTTNADDSKTSMTTNSKSFLCRQTSLDEDNGYEQGNCGKDSDPGSCFVESTHHRRPHSVRNFSNVSDNIRSMDADDVVIGPIAVDHGEILRHSSSRKNSHLTSAFSEECVESGGDCFEFFSPSMNNNRIKLPNNVVDSLIIKQESIQEFCSNETKQTSANVSLSSITKCDGDLSIASSSNINLSHSKNELSTPARASLSLKSRKIPLELIDSEQIIDPRSNPPNILIVNDLPIPHFAHKKSSIVTAHQSSPLKAARPDLKIETLSSNSQGLNQTHSQHALLQTRSSSGSDLSPLLSNGGDVSASSDALMSPPSAGGSVCWPTPSTDIFGESLSPVTPVSGESRASFEERIKALDDKFTEIDRMMKNAKERPMHRSSAAANVDYSKYKVVKKPSNPLPPILSPMRSMSTGNSSTLSVAANSVVSTPVLPSPSISETKSSYLISKSSVFDQDLQRLSSIEEKYTPVPSTSEVAKYKATDEIKEPVTVLKAPLTINIPPPSSNAPMILTSNSSVLPIPSPSTTVSSAPPIIGSAAITPLSPTGPLQGILKNKPKTPTSCPPIGLPVTTPVTPVTPLDTRLLTSSQQQPVSSVGSSNQIQDARIQRKDSLKSPTNENTARPTTSTSTNAVVKPLSDPRQINAAPINRPVNRPSGGSTLNRQSESSLNDVRPRLPSTPSTPTSYNVDPRLLGRSTSFAAAPKQEKTFGLRHFDRPTENKPTDNATTASVSCVLSSSKESPMKIPPPKMNDNHPKELRNKDLDKLFKNKSVDVSSSERVHVDNDSFSGHNSSNSKNAPTDRLPKIKKKSSNVEKDKSSSSKNDGEIRTSNERKKDNSSSSEKRSHKEIDREREKKKVKEKHNEKMKEKDSRQKFKFKSSMTDEERRKLLKQKHKQLLKEKLQKQQESKENTNKKALKQAREEKLNKMLKQKRLKTSGSKAKSSNDDANSNSGSSSTDSEEESERRAAKNLEKEWKKTLEAIGGEPVGLSMYDRVKRRSSATYTDPWKKVSGKDKFSRLRQQRLKGKSHHRRVKCDDDSDVEDEENDDKNSMDDNDDDSSSNFSNLELEPERDIKEKEKETENRKKSESESKKLEKSLKKHHKKDKEKLSITDVWSDESSSSCNNNEGLDDDVTKSSDESDKPTKKMKEAKHKKIKIHHSSSGDKHQKPQKTVNVDRLASVEHRDSKETNDRRSLKEKTSSSSSQSPQKRGPGRPKKNREPSEGDERSRAKSPSKKDHTSENKKDQEKKKHKIKKDKPSSKYVDSSSPKKKSKHSGEDEKTKDSSKKRKRIDASSSEVEQTTSAESKKMKLEISRSNSNSNPSKSFSGHAFLTKAALKQVDLTPPVMTKGAKKALFEPGTSQEKHFASDEKSADQQTKPTSDEQRCVIQSLDNAEISADIVQALKNSGPDEPMETEPIEVSVQEVVIAEVDREEIIQETIAHPSTSPKLQQTTSLDETKDDDSTLALNETLPAVDPFGALSVKVDELGENLHQDLAEQKSDVSSHVDEVIDDVVHGYVEIEPEKLKRMATQANQKISPAETSSEQSKNSFEKDNAMQNRVASVDTSVQQPLTVAPLPPNMNQQHDFSAMKHDHHVEGLLATAEQQRKDLMLRQIQQIHQHETPPAQRQLLADVGQQAARSLGQMTLAQPQNVSVPFSSAQTPPGQQFPSSFLATSTPMNHLQPGTSAPTPPYPPRVPSGGSSLTLPSNQFALYDMQIQKQQAAWAAAGLLGPNAMMNRFPSTSAAPAALERELLEQQRFLAEQQRQAAIAAAAAQVQHRFAGVVSSAPTNFLANSAHHPMMTNASMASNAQQNDALMSHRWLLDRYPVIWQGYLALKNDMALVQMHLVSGNPQLLPHSLPGATESNPIPVLRIMQRMRLEPQQLDGVGRRMQLKEEHCVLVVLPCGQDRNHIIQQSSILNTAFITYLQQKQAAGIVNIIPAGATQPAYVVHVFPPCDFAQQSLLGTACDFLQSIVERQTSFLFVVVTTVQGT